MNSKIREVYCYLLRGLVVSSQTTSPHYYWIEAISKLGYHFLLRIDRSVDE